MQKTRTEEFDPSRSFFPTLLLPFPNVNSPKNTKTAATIPNTATVKPAPKKPAPTGEILSWCAATALAPTVPFPAYSAAHPRNCVCPHALHHCSVVLMPAGANACKNVERGTSLLDPSHPVNRIGYGRYVASSVPFLNVKRTTGLEPEDGWRTSSTTDAA